MVTQALLDFAADFASWIAGLFGTFALPDWFVNLDTYVNQVTGAIDGTSPWVPWPLVIGVATAVISAYLVCLGIKLILKIAAFVPFVGGSG